MAHEKNHDYHILPPSVNPFLGALAALVCLQVQSSGCMEVAPIFSWQVLLVYFT